MSDLAANEWKPNEEFLHALIGMGIPHAAAEQALFCTDNSSLEAATSYVFDSFDADELDKSVSSMNISTRKRPKNKKQKDDSSEVPDVITANNYKMVFVVNMALKMKTGKIAAQVAHGCLGLYRKLLDTYSESIVEDWEEEGWCIMSIGENHLQLINLMEKAKREKLVTYLVQDAGRTEVPPNSLTVLAVFGHDINVNNVTGDLNLL